MRYSTNSLPSISTGHDPSLTPHAMLRSSIFALSCVMLILLTSLLLTTLPKSSLSKSNPITTQLSQASVPQQSSSAQQKRSITSFAYATPVRSAMPLPSNFDSALPTHAPSPSLTNSISFISHPSSTTRATRSKTFSAMSTLKKAQPYSDAARPKTSMTFARKPQAGSTGLTIEQLTPSLSAAFSECATTPTSTHCGKPGSISQKSSRSLMKEPLPFVMRSTASLSASAWPPPPLTALQRFSRATTRWNFTKANSVVPLRVTRSITSKAASTTTA